MAYKPRYVGMLIALTSLTTWLAPVALAGFVGNCEEVYFRGFTSSGSYTIYNSKGIAYEIFCWFTTNGAGWAFPSQASVSQMTFDLSQLQTSNADVMVYFWMKTGNLQRKSIVSPLDSGSTVAVSTSWQSAIPGLDPAVVGPYLYASIDGMTSDPRLLAKLTTTVSTMPDDQPTSDRSSASMYAPITDEPTIDPANISDSTEAATDISGGTNAITSSLFSSTTSTISSLESVSNSTASESSDGGSTEVSAVFTGQTMTTDHVYDTINATTSEMPIITSKISDHTEFSTDVSSSSITATMSGNPSSDTESETISVEFTPSTVADTTTSDNVIRGFLSNGNPVLFESCDRDISGTSANYLVFFPTQPTLSESEYDTNGILSTWVSNIPHAKTFTTFNNTVLSRFFFCGEMYFGTCGGALRYIGPNYAQTSGIVRWSLGVHFQMSDECASSPCPSDAICRNDYRSHHCICQKPGYLFNGTACDIVNIAFNKPATQSSTFNDQTATLANDGDVATCMSTAQELKPWWQLDLGHFYHVIGIAVYTGTDSGSATVNSGNIAETSQTELEVRLGNVESNPSPYSLCTTQSISIFSPSELVWKCSRPVRGRYIRIQRVNSDFPDHLVICEVKVVTAEVNIAASKIIYGSDPTPPPMSSNSSERLTWDFCSNKSLVSTMNAGRDSWWMVDMMTTVDVDYIEITADDSTLCPQNSTCGKQPSLMKFYAGRNGLSPLNNAAYILNSSSPFVGTTRRWYCSGTCSGRFLGIYLYNSNLGSLQGCSLKIYAPLRAIYRSVVTTQLVPNAYLPGSSFKAVNVSSFTECVSACAVNCRSCVSINSAMVGHERPGDVNSDAKWSCELNFRSANVTSQASSIPQGKLLSNKTNWNFYAVEALTCA